VFRHRNAPANLVFPAPSLACLITNEFKAFAARRHFPTTMARALLRKVVHTDAALV